jgi:osmotically-inducible protein OsmY
MEIAQDGALILEGTMKNVAAKKLGLELAAAMSGVRAIVDRLKVAPSAPMTDDEICDHVRDALLQEPAMLNCAIQVRAKGRVENVRAAMAEPSGFIEIAVDDGNVLLEGQAPSLSHKRLAGVLAWWVPGSANVLNRIEVTPPEEDNDDEITDATRIALEKHSEKDRGCASSQRRGRRVASQSDDARSSGGSLGQCAFVGRTRGG